MKISIIKPLSILLFLLPLLQACKDVANTDEKNNDTIATPFVENQIIVIYKETTQPQQRSIIKDTILSINSKANSVTCVGCDNYVELWTGEGIHSAIHAQGITSARHSTGGSGEDSLAYYSLNFISHLPYDAFPDNPNFLSPIQAGNVGTNEIVVAVLDTGIDTALINNTYLWQNWDVGCYPGAKLGWNYVNNSIETTDDNLDHHGTIVAGYIINQFAKAPENFVRIMNLKTHDKDGNGELFNNICAIRFAKNHNANIINASWGFYYYGEQPHAYLDTLITRELKQEGILFFAAAGNSISEFDTIAQNLGLTPRDLESHHFYPAFLSDSINNVITITTTNGGNVSPTQNYSYKHVDLGVESDTTNGNYYQFKPPFARGGNYVSGSSFATPIAAGKIGAYLPADSHSFVISSNKEDLLTLLSSIQGPGGIPIINENPTLSRFIREGRNMDK